MKLPEFKAYQQIKIGSVTLTNTVHLFNISGYYPIIIGKGDLMPKVWLYAIVRGEIHNIVNNNNSNLLPLKFEYNEKNHMLTYTFVNQVLNQDICILSIESDQNGCTITKLDLRPFGVKIYLDGNTLNVGPAKFENSMFNNSNTFVTVE